MDKNNTPKRWFTNGATMSYPSRGRSIYWVVNLILYGLLNMFYLRMQTGVWWQTKSPYSSIDLIDQLLWPLNIFHFPMQIIIIALLMGLLCTIPIIIAQLYNLMYAVPFLAASFLLGHNSVLTLCLLVSCAAVSFEPMRFKSKFVSAIVCLLPEVLYWLLFSRGNPEQDVHRWAVIYAPWGLAFLISVLILGVVLTVGHVLRYRPGGVMPVFGLMLAGTVILFHYSIGMDERDFQAQVFRYSPGEIPELQNRSIIPQLEQEFNQWQKQFPYLTPELIMSQLRWEWKLAFGPASVIGSSDLNNLNEGNPAALAKREAWKVGFAQANALDHINEFIKTEQHNKRLADALYYLGQLLDLSVDMRTLYEEDALRFYTDIPKIHSEKYWHEIVDRFGQTEVSIEARWRLSRLAAARQPERISEPYHFEKALELLQEADKLCQQKLQERKENSHKTSLWNKWLATVFSAPPDTITLDELAALQMKIGQLMMLIKENRSGHPQQEQRLAKFIDLDSHQLNYEDQLKTLRLNSSQPDPLIDNIELAQALLFKDPDAKIVRLTELTRQYPDRDGGVEAMLELALVLMEQRNRSGHLGDRETLLEQSRKYLQNIITAQPGTYLAKYAQALLNQNPLE